MKTRWRSKSNKQLTLNRGKWNKKTALLNQLFTSMSDNIQTCSKASHACATCSQRLLLSPCACRQTKMEEATRSYLWGKALQQSGLKRRADAAATAVIPLTTSHGGHPLHVQIVACASSRPLEELTTKTKKRRTQSAELHQKIVQPPIPFIPPPFHKLSPRECMTFAQLSG